MESLQHFDERRKVVVLDRISTAIPTLEECGPFPSSAYFNIKQRKEYNSQARLRSIFYMASKQFAKVSSRQIFS